MYLRGIIGPIISLAIYCGAVDVGNQEDAELGKEQLRRLFEGTTPEKQDLIQQTLEPFFMNELSIAMTEPDITPRMMRILNVCREVSPIFRSMFDLSTVLPALDIEEQRATGRSKARLIPLASPPAGKHVRRKAVVAVRDLFFPQFNNSRRFEMGPAIVNAMRAYNWDADFLGMDFNGREENDCRRIVEACVGRGINVIVLDAVILHFPECIQMIAEMRRAAPDLKIIGIYFDAWPVKAKQLKESSLLLDLIWTLSPDLEAWQQPEFNGKLFFAPFPRGGDFGGPILPLLPKATFIGGVAGYNWHRALWIAAMRTEQMPVESRMTEFKTDGLSAMESYVLYMRRFADSRCSLNFSMRSNMTFIVTGRSFDIPAVGSLLVHERCAELDCYFIEGEHYLPFTTFAELRQALKFIQERPAEAEDIRRRGNAFFRERYLDDKLIGYMDQALYHGPAASVT